MYQILEPENLRQLDLLQLRSRKKFLGTRQGGNASIKRGSGIEFADYRRYELGDDPRHIDWGVFGRTERLYVKQFQEEQDLTVYCLIDATNSMHAPKTDRKFFASSEVGLGLLYVALAHHNRVKISVPGYKDFGPFSGAARVHQVGEFFRSVPVVDPLQFEKGFSRFLYSVDFPGVCIYISDFLSPLEELSARFEALYTRNLDVLAVRILGPHDIDPFNNREQALFVDSETGEELPLENSEATRSEYRFRFQQHTKQLRNICSKYQVRYVEYLSTDPVIDFFSDDIAGTGFLRR